MLLRIEIGSEKAGKSPIPWLFGYSQAGQFNRHPFYRHPFYHGAANGSPTQNPT